MPDNLVQTYINFKNAYKKLQQFIQEDNDTELARSGIIHAYEFTFELFWKFLQKYLDSELVLEEHGPSAVVRKAFEYGYIQDGQACMNMLRDRNLITHTYKEDMAKEIYTRIKEIHINTLGKIIEKFDNIM